MAFKPSKYQSAIFDWVTDTNTPSGRADKIADKEHVDFASLLVEARAGSGKTTTGIEIFKLIPPFEDSIFLAFNSHIAKELQIRLPKGSNARTYHSAAFQAIRNAYGQVQVDADKVEKLLNRMSELSLCKYNYPAIKKLVGLCKNNLLVPDHDTLMNLAFFHDIDIYDVELVVEKVTEVLDLCSRQVNTIDFDDMIWLPIYHNLSLHKYEFMFIDELQDTNACQMEFVYRSIGQGGRLIGVGDRYQSIYAFRGADAGAVPNFSRRTEAEQLGLPVTYRNPQLVVDLVRGKFPEIGLEARENAPAGIFDILKEDKLMQEVIPGDMVLCRTNAPMVEYVFALIRNGQKAIIRGRDIGKSLQSFIKKFQENDLKRLLRKIEDYESAEMAKFMEKDHISKAQHLQDKCQTVYAIADGATTVDELRTRIETIFSDDNEGITFSTVHKAKGLEARRILILRPDLLPHPMARKDWAKQQERNIEYVAYTRALNDLLIVQ